MLPTHVAKLPKLTYIPTVHGVAWLAHRIPCTHWPPPRTTIATFAIILGTGVHDNTGRFAASDTCGQARPNNIHIIVIPYTD